MEGNLKVGCGIQGVGEGQEVVYFCGAAWELLIFFLREVACKTVDNYQVNKTSKTW